MALCRFTVFAALATAVAACLAQTSAPSAAAIFKEAKADAAQLPSLLAVREAKLIADYEEPGDPAQALSDYKALYNQVHAWPIENDTPAQKAQADLRFLVEHWAIETYAQKGKFKQALLWLHAYDPGDIHHQDPEWEYGFVIRVMLAKQDYAGVPGAFAQCASESDGFSFYGAAKAVGATPLPALQRMALAQDGIQAAATAAPRTEYAARFLTAVHQAFPSFDNEVEDAAVSLLANAHADAAQHHDHAAQDERGGGLLLTLLRAIDPGRAVEEHVKYPADAAPPSNNGIIMLSTTGKVEGIAVGQNPIQKLTTLAGSNLDGAMTGATRLTDKDSRFAALAEIANVSAKAHPQRAAESADEAYALADKDIAATEVGYTVDLGHAYAILGQPDRAHDLAGMALDDINQNAENVENQFDLSSPEGIVKVYHNLAITSFITSIEYRSVAAFAPAVALAHARACPCAVLQPLMLARIAEGLSPAGAQARP